MRFCRDRIYPHLVSMLGNPKPIDEIRLGRGCDFQNGMRALTRCSEDMENHV
jgi:hypothetical protein